MNPATAFFFTVVLLQLVFTGLLISIVARRFPSRLRLYHFLAPAAVPLLLFGAIVISLLTGARGEYATGFDASSVLIRIFLAYSVLWLVGVLWSTMLIRWMRR